MKCTPDYGTERWINRADPGSADRPVRLFCLPYAGGGASLYRSWPADLPAVDVAAVQLPGREDRADEPASSCMAEVVGGVADAVVPLLDRPYAVFGHSMGARIAFELARELRRRDLPAPAVLFVSAGKAPHIPRVPTPPLSTMPDRLFLRVIQNLDGMPPEIATDADFRQAVLPTLRADMGLVDSYEYVDEPALGMPIRAFGGTQDTDVREDDLTAWQVHTTAAFRLRMLRGGHFVVRTCRRELTRAVADELSALVGAGVSADR